MTDERRFPVGLVGESKYQAAIQAARIGDVVQVVHEYDNPHDPLALPVINTDGAPIGYLSTSSWLRSAIHDEGKGCKATIHAINRGERGLLGVVIEVTLNDAGTRRMTRAELQSASARIGPVQPGRSDPAASSSIGRSAASGLGFTTGAGIGCLLLIAVFAVLIALGRSTDDGNSAAPFASTDNRAATAPTGQRWNYTSYTDEVRGGRVTQAILRSDNSIDLDFPYERTGLTMTVRRHPEYGLDVIFQADDGQILCHTYECQATISFDGRAERLSLNRSGDHDPKVVFARHPEAILRKLQRSRRTLVELTFYRQGAPSFTFQTQGLTWPPPQQAASQ